ncbi:SDR family oxidoreductase [Rhizobium laguerreae]|uniref:SDR family NAD(P)-dependent oxidoreductase n=1 Tax=Rhizobium laguerreae TaxID=1076926 RepID=UPI001C902870|nr:SDR family NAD(P)-dependent oxidoreductase [Rhizobium laguerreae]MBY3217737.1 SDR family oxidoreductase [Rhizobium laguerreae]
MNTNKNVVVTGVSGVLGTAISTNLKDSGWNVIGIDLQPSASCKTVLVDLADASQIRVGFQSIIDDYGELHALVNNAGVFLGRSWDEITDDETSLTLGVNLRAPLLISTLFAKNAIARGLKASIVNVSSVAGREPGHDIVYAASKAALIQATRGLGRQLAGQGIRVNAVAPGVIEGSMADRIPEPGRSAYRQRTPMQRFADPAEIASVVSFLLSPDASYMTGATIDANGGLF